MKNLSHIFDAVDISQGLLINEYRPHGRVTVEIDWQLNLTGQSVGNSNKGPFRWYQRGDGDREETEVPGVGSISIDRNLDQDAATCQIRMANQKMNLNGAPQELVDQLGRPGYYTPDRGVSEESQARWEHEVNEWQNVFTPMALIRTYQGYGGYDEDGIELPIEDCLAAGFLTLTGTWMADTVTIGTDGYLNIKCRDAAKLLIEQQLYKPLVPAQEYPLRYYRWVYNKVSSAWDPMPPKTTSTGSARSNFVTLNYYWSSAADWYGHNPSIHGHRDLDLLDGNPQTFALSVGNSHPSRPFCTDYWEFDVNQEINKIYLHPWAGNYEMYISVLENGAWQSNGEGPITWDTASLEATQFVAPDVLSHSRAIPYVLREGVPWEEGRIYTLPRTFRAQRIRISFRNHVQSQWGPWYYRVGIREVAGLLDENTVTTQTEDQPLYCFGIATGNEKDGYFLADAYGRQWAFGDMRSAPHNDPYGLAAYVIATSGIPSGDGYYAVETDGTVHAYGSAVWYGSPKDTDGVSAGDFIDIAVTHTGNGYYVLRRSGGVYTYGDAVFYGSMTPTAEILADAAVTGDGDAYYATAIATHPTADGYWIINGLGQIREFNTTNYGEFAASSRQHDAWPRGIVATADGGGYWVIYGNGQMGHFGNATDFGDLLLYNSNPSGEATNYREIWWDIERSPGDGVWVLRADGLVIGLGDAYAWGSLGSEGEQRSPGNYLDYSDIVRELLLWSGFHLFVSPHPGGDRPYVHGNIEDTGVYSEEDLDETMFDKKSVIDAIRQLRDIVGYSIWVDEEGGFHFESPNWWAPGNFFEDGTRTTFIPEIDEGLQLTDYTVTFDDQSLRSEIIISNYMPEDSMEGTITTRIVPQGAQLLRGMCKPAMWVNEAFLRSYEQEIMAELISMQIWFQQRQGQVTCIANPAIQINDQVRIYERVTSESYIHYVRGISTNMDLNTGEYTMSLTTNWLGSELDWTIERNPNSY